MKLIIFELLFSIIYLIPEISHAVISDAWIFECNETTGMLGITTGRIERGKNSNNHVGWTAQSLDGNYRIWTLPIMSAKNEKTQWRCQIHGKEAQIIMKLYIDPHIGKYLGMNLIYDGRYILQDIVMDFNHINVDSPKELMSEMWALKTLYFSKDDYRTSDTFLLHGLCHEPSYSKSEANFRTRLNWPMQTYEIRRRLKDMDANLPLRSLNQICWLSN